MDQEYFLELQRFRRVARRSGVLAARRFAQQTLAIYREAVANPRHHAATREYRPKFEASIRALAHLTL